MENVQIRAESFEKQYYVGAWEKETERQIRMYLSESGIPGAAVSVTLEPGNTGEAKEIRIEAPMRQTSIYREEQKKQREMLDEKLTEIKSVLSEVYGTDPAHLLSRFRSCPAYPLRFQGEAALHTSSFHRSAYRRDAFPFQGRLEARPSHPGLGFRCGRFFSGAGCRAASQPRHAT